MRGRILASLFVERRGPEEESGDNSSFALHCSKLYWNLWANSSFLKKWDKVAIQLNLFYKIAKEK